MPIINREDAENAQKITEQLIPDDGIRRDILTFLSKAIVYANGLMPDNWNINVDKNSKFVRFNVGQEYCIQMNSTYLLILALKKYVPIDLIENHSVEFKGSQGKKTIISRNLEEVPDDLVKVFDSVGCMIHYENITADLLSILEDANQRFLEKAITSTSITPMMIRTHSPGFIAYLSDYCAQYIPNPSYLTEQSEDIFEDIERYRTNADGLTETERQEIIRSRVGQGKFREDLVWYWNGECAVSGCKNTKLLRASHIKPWRASDNRERLDVFNGLLLVPNLDAAFDVGYISFENDGCILISSLLTEEDKDQLGIHSGLRISRLAKQHGQYLEYHRAHIFKNG